MLRGLTPVTYQSSDLAAATRWYSELLGIEPYFVTPAYVEFPVGDSQHELGLLDTRYLPEPGLLDTRYLPEPGGGAAASTGPGGGNVYWHVDDVPATLDRLLLMGATAHHPPRDFGEGFIGASVVDPFGNLLGVMYDPHHLEVLAGRA